MTRTRPDFLQKTHENGATIVAAFRALPLSEASAVDRWLMSEGVIHGRTWQEDCLFRFINEHDELEACLA